MVLTDWWVGESDLGSSHKGYTGYKEVLGGKDDIGGPNQANPEALAFILWCPKAISEWFENPVILGLINELGLTPLPPLQTMSAFLTVFFVRELPLKLSYLGGGGGTWSYWNWNAYLVSQPWGISIHIVVSKVHFWVIRESGKFGLKKGTGVDHPPTSPPTSGQCPLF